MKLQEFAATANAPRCRYLHSRKRSSSPRNSFWSFGKPSSSTVERLPSGLLLQIKGGESWPHTHNMKFVQDTARMSGIQPRWHDERRYYLCTPMCEMNGETIRPRHTRDAVWSLRASTPALIYSRLNTTLTRATPQFIKMLAFLRLRSEKRLQHSTRSICGISPLVTDN